MKNKYGSEKVSHAGYSFASKLEAALFDLLTLRERAGEIKDIKCQDCVYLTDARILYKPDFTYWDIKINQQVWAESKGFETDVWRIKRRLWQFYGPGILIVHGASKGSVVEREKIIPRKI